MGSYSKIRLALQVLDKVSKVVNMSGDSPLY